LSYLLGEQTEGEFPTLKLTNEFIPAGNSGSTCVHLAWRDKAGKHEPEAAG